MRFPHLKMAMAERRVPQYQVADLLRLSDAGFSRRLTGRTEFAPHEKQRIAEFLGLDAAWLFDEVRIPASARFRETAALSPAMETR